MAKTGSTRAWLSFFGAVLMTVCAMVPLNLTSLYMKNMVTALNTTVGMLAIIVTISTCGSIVASLTIGRVLNVLNQRIVILFSAACVFALQFSISASNSLIPIYIAAFFNGLGMVWGGIAMGQIIITQWFEKSRGSMMGVCMISMGLVMTITIPVIGTLLNSISYRSIVLAIGIISGVVMVLSTFLVSGAPEKYGLKPHGAADAQAALGGEAGSPAAPQSLSFKGVLGSPVFWAIFVIMLLANVVQQGFISQAVVIFGSLGLEATQASFAFALFMILGMILTFVYGFISDKFGTKNATAICGGISAVILLTAFFWTGWIGAVVFAVGLAAGGGIASLYGQTLAPRLFGMKAVGDIIGFVVLASSIGASIGPLLIGLMYDTFGNYTVALTIMGVIMAVCLLINFWLNSKTNLENVQKKIAAENAQLQA